MSITLSALVTGFPHELRAPKPLPGESMLQLVIRNHPKQWSNCLERLRKDFNATDEVCSRLRRGEFIQGLNPVLHREVEKFMSFRLPSHGRTLQGLAKLRDHLREPDSLGDIWKMSLNEIMWVRRHNPAGDAVAQTLATSLGVTILEFEANAPRAMDLDQALARVRSDFLWILPGGTNVPVLVLMPLIRVMRAFQDNPRLAFYRDGCYSVIHRTSAVRSLLDAGKSISPDSKAHAQLLQEAGFTFAADEGPAHCLAELETIYGGKFDAPTPYLPATSMAGAESKPSLWSRIFGTRK